MPAKGFRLTLTYHPLHLACLSSHKTPEQFRQRHFPFSDIHYVPIMLAVKKRLGLSPRRPCQSCTPINQSNDHAWIGRRRSHCYLYEAFVKVCFDVETGEVDFSRISHDHLSCLEHHVRRSCD
jgi:hypothetical protein